MQDLVLRGLIEGHEEVKKRDGKHGALTGTSNVSLPSSELFFPPPSLRHGTGHDLKLTGSGVLGSQVRLETDRNDSARVDHGDRGSLRLQRRKWSSHGHVGTRSVPSFPLWHHHCSKTQKTRPKTEAKTWGLTS